MSDERFRQCDALLELAVRRIDQKYEAKQFFLIWPSLKEASIRLCSYLSPFLEANGVPLLDLALSRALSNATASQASEQVGAFVEGVASITDAVCGIQVSVQDRDGDWEIWDFEHPILDWMQSNKRESLQIRTRQEPFPEGPVRFAILRVFSTRDLMQTRLEVHF